TPTAPCPAASSFLSGLLSCARQAVVDNLCALRRRAMDRHAQTCEFSRRTSRTATGVVLVGVALAGCSPHSKAAMRRPWRGGTLQLGPLLDTSGLDAHRHNPLLTSNVNDELPHFHLHAVTMTAAVKAPRGYQPDVTGVCTYRGGGCAPRLSRRNLLKNAVQD